MLRAACCTYPRSPSAGSALRRVCFVATVCRAPFIQPAAVQCPLCGWPCTRAHQPRTTPARQCTVHSAAPTRLAAGAGGGWGAGARIQWCRMAFNGREWACMLPPAPRPSAFNAIVRAFYFRAAAWHGVHACNAPDAPLLIFRQNPGGGAGCVVLPLGWGASLHVLLL
jgi:hypothetical protein